MNKELKQMYDDDQHDRRTGRYWKEPERDMYRLARVQEMVANSELEDAYDYAHAAMLLLHGRVVGHYRLAAELAFNASQLADEEILKDMRPDPLGLYARAVDRTYIAEGKLQKYGTHYDVDENGNYHLCEVDPKTTDAQRALFHVSPLARAYEVADELTREDKNDRL